MRTKVKQSRNSVGDCHGFASQRLRRFATGFALATTLQVDCRAPFPDFQSGLAMTGGARRAKNCQRVPLELLTFPLIGQRYAISLSILPPVLERPLVLTARANQIPSYLLASRNSVGTNKLSFKCYFLFYQGLICLMNCFSDSTRFSLANSTTVYSYQRHNFN